LAAILNSKLDNNPNVKKSISFSFVDTFQEAFESQLVISLISKTGDSDQVDNSVHIYEEVSYTFTTLTLRCYEIKLLILSKKKESFVIEIEQF
jgi:hypothetical protein